MSTSNPRKVYRIWHPQFGLYHSFGKERMPIATYPTVDMAKVKQAALNKPGSDGPWQILEDDK